MIYKQKQLIYILKEAGMECDEFYSQNQTPQMHT